MLPAKADASALALVMLLSMLTLACSSAVNAQIVHATPSFVYSPLTPRVGDVVTFDALWWEQYWNENNEPRSFSYSWSFGDGAHATGATVNHTFTKSGTYNVGVTVDDGLRTGGSSEMKIEVREQTPVTVHIFLSSESIYTGQEVVISGNLTRNGEGMPNAWVSLLSKTYVEGATWNDIASVKTDAYGKFSTVWKPIYGVYQVKATWAGDSTYPESSVSVELRVKGFGNFITEFSSNSTINELNYNATTRVLSFTAEGPSGTNGYVSVTLEKDSSFDPLGISVLLDGHPIEYNVESTGESWILFFTYTHSIHNVLVNFEVGKISEPTSSTPLEQQETSPSLQFETALTLVILVIVTCLGLALYFKKHKR